jgi:hypothetical protein
MRRRRHDAWTMNSTSANVVLFAFHDAGRVAEVVAAAGAQTGVVSLAVVGRSAESEIRIIGRVGQGAPEAGWLASLLAVLDVLSWPLRVLAGSPSESEPVILPDSDDGFAAFARMVPRGTLVILLAVCDDSKTTSESFESQIGAALYRLPAYGEV